MLLKWSVRGRLEEGFSNHTKIEPKSKENLNQQWTSRTARVCSQQEKPMVLRRTRWEWWPTRRWTWCRDSRPRSASARRRSESGSSSCDWRPLPASLLADCQTTAAPAGEHSAHIITAEHEAQPKTRVSWDGRTMATMGTSQLLTRSTLQLVTAVTSWPSCLATLWRVDPTFCCIQELRRRRWLRYCTRCNNLTCCTCMCNVSFLSSFHAHK